ncbi:hypothetical protein MMC10_011391 [Thelotrema lepadinum]|nr:hypothetical protein [Thelotrema lepadinum]
MSSLWGSRFQTTKTTRQTRDRRLSNDKDLGDVFASAYESLPQIDSHCLTSDKLLGLGSMFHVNREIYCEQRESPSKFYVAVKYVRMEQPPETHHQIVIALLRELKVITHPVLRSHPHIMSAFGYGWTGFNSKESRPFIVMPYADFGTLSEALQATQQHRQVSILERYELALNVASGLHALHEHGIVHGDVKSNNVLVCTRSEPLGHATVDYGPPWVAKLADFGSSMSLKEADEQSFGYTGTPLYNAPEIEDYHSEGSHNGSFEAYKKADVYSFGLLLWEVMKVGCFYLETYRDNDISYRKKRYREYLQKVHHRPGDALLEIALRSLEDMKDEIADFQYWDATTGALTACLRKNASLRASSMAVLENLRDSVRYAADPSPTNSDLDISLQK